MRYKASEKREIIDLVERSSLPVRRSLDQLGIPKSTFYGWYERFREGGDEALVDGRPGSPKTWNRIPDTVRESIVELALQKPELSARELAVRYTERQGYFVSESSVYRLLKAHDLITSLTGGAILRLWLNHLQGHSAPYLQHCASRCTADRRSTRASRVPGTIQARPCRRSTTRYACRSSLRRFQSG